MSAKKYFWSYDALTNSVIKLFATVIIAASAHGSLLCMQAVHEIVKHHTGANFYS